MEEKKLKELEQRSFENAMYVSKTPTEEACQVFFCEISKII